jgi:hypothetical protein
LEEQFGNSINAVLKLLNGNILAMPAMGFEVCEVRSATNLRWASAS